VDVAKRMESQFNEKTADLFKEATEKDIRNDTLIVLASLVQRETANEEEMPIIAGVIWNRWLKDMPFQIDATIQYVLGEPGNWWPIIKPEDYKLDSPYNTYLHKGRPPTPICNPGLATIDAVINSEETEYLYYLHDGEGQIHLAKTYEEHQANIEQYLLETVTGTIEDIALSAKVITIRDPQEKEISVAITERTTLLDKDGNEIELKDLQPGENISAAGRWTGEDTFIPSIIRRK
jgi:predicted RNase H-like HicB family nuclease